MSELSHFLDQLGSRPYNQFVELHVQQHSTQRLQTAVLEETLSLPENLQQEVMGFIDFVNLFCAHDQHFWRVATNRDAFQRILHIAISRLPLAGVINSVDDALRPENHDLANTIFLIATLSFAYSASTQRAQRKFMGIRKGFFG